MTPAAGSWSWRPLPGNRGDDPSPPRRVAESLPAVSRRIGGPDGAFLVQLMAGWEAIVGPVVAAHSRPLRLAEGTLTVAVDQPGWATELTYQAGRLRERVDEAVGGGVVDAVKVVVRAC